MVTQVTNEELLNTILSCLKDDEDGQGYLWDTLKGREEQLKAIFMAAPVYTLPVHPDEQWKGIFKVVEEAGELLTVLGKMGAFPSGEHPDGKGNLVMRAMDEIADLNAAQSYFVQKNGLDAIYLEHRTQSKFKQFLQWGLTGLRSLGKSN